MSKAWKFDVVVRRLEEEEGLPALVLEDDLAAGVTIYSPWDPLQFSQMVLFRIIIGTIHPSCSPKHALVFGLGTPEDR